VGSPPVWIVIVILSGAHDSNKVDMMSPEWRIYGNIRTLTLRTTRRLTG